jgi:hypothetical protein
VATLTPAPAAYLKSALSAKAKVLLVNPPVQEKRYHWLRWNQPLELLRLSTWLKENVRLSDVRLFDFMFPDENGAIPRHKVKETWTASASEALWHFGEPFETFERYLDEHLKRGWVPDLIIITSLTSYWHGAIEKLLLRICNLLGPSVRTGTTIALYGAYPVIEAEHAERQTAADVAFTSYVDVGDCAPDFRLYFEQWGRGPLFFGLDINTGDVAEHLAMCLAMKSGWLQRIGVVKPPTIIVAFLNDDICGPKSRLAELAKQADRFEGRVRIDAICGVKPRSTRSDELRMLAQLGAKSIYIESATRPDGGLDEEAYTPFREFLVSDRERRRGGDDTELARRDAVTAFINVGLPNDDIETIVRNTLILNQYFQAIILKPFGYSPDIDSAPARVRRKRWPQPAASSPQWFPYVGHGSVLTLEDYDNLMRWQGIVNKRVKSFTFDFLADAAVPKLVRETLIEESWKRKREGRA